MQQLNSDSLPSTEALIYLLNTVTQYEEEMDVVSDFRSTVGGAAALINGFELDDEKLGRAREMVDRSMKWIEEEYSCGLLRYITSKTIQESLSHRMKDAAIMHFLMENRINMARLPIVNA